MRAEVEISTWVPNTRSETPAIEFPTSYELVNRESGQTIHRNAITGGSKGEINKRRKRCRAFTCPLNSFDTKRKELDTVWLTSYHQNSNLGM